VTNDDLLSNVERLLPQGKWPVGIHRQVAETIGISRSVAFNAISTLILNGRVRPPSPSPVSRIPHPGG
jgi:hypothetical protein